MMAEQAKRQTQRIPQFENNEVKVWRSVIAPNQPLQMHRHDHPRVIVALAGGTLRITKQSGAGQTVTWEAGKAYWLPADPPDELHGDVNEGERPIDVIVVELKKAR
jgi:quercetin dioxygenase-like cupin family protein